MAIDLSIDLIHATVELEQPIANGKRTVGTGFLVSDPTPDGRPRIVLVTANHVFRRMPGDRATIGFRIQNTDGSWNFAPETIAIRSGGHELWTHHGDRDVAVISITVPPAFAKAAIPLSWLGADDSFQRASVGPGDEMMTLGYPEGLSANSAGFPILRAGRVASYPLTPSAAFPTFLLDFRVFPGNSGGPVYLTDAARRRAGPDGAEPTPFIAGLLTQEVEQNDQNLAIGIVTQSRFIRETLNLLDHPGAPTTGAMVDVSADAATPATATAVAADSVAVSP